MVEGIPWEKTLRGIVTIVLYSYSMCELCVCVGGVYTCLDEDGNKPGLD